MAQRDRWDFASGVRPDRLMELAREFSKGVRISGSPDEAQAFDFAASELERLGYSVHRESCEALVGYPVTSRLETLEPERREFACNGYSLSPATPPDGVIGELVDVGAGAESDYEGREVQGRVVLSTGLAMPGKAVVADRTQPLGQIHVNDERIHEMCVSQVWGIPEPHNAGQLPKTPAVGITAADGERLRAMLHGGRLIVRLVTQPYLDWRPIPTVTADLPGTVEDSFILFSGHIDSWYHGAMDNGSANAVQLAIAELLADARSELRRGIRLAFWSGHSHGRYAGSCWYADTHWQELYDRCRCHVNIDSVGARGAEVLSEAPTMAETHGFAAGLIRDGANQDLRYRRISRSGDQSFWGIGFPSLFSTLSEQRATGSATEAAQAELLGSTSSSGGLGWWWHTTEDTLDKLDPALLERDARIYGAAIWDLCTGPRLPFDFAAAAREIGELAGRHSAAGQGAIDLSTVAALAGELASSIERLQESTELSNDRVNKVLADLGHVLIPVNYTAAGPFHQDPALSTPGLPGLAGAARLGELAAGDPERRYLSTSLLRERNRIIWALSAAQGIVEEALEQFSSTSTRSLS